MLYDLIEELLLSGELWQALDEGRTGMVHVIGEAASAMLETVSPAYASAILICEEAPPQLHCIENLERIRDAAITLVIDGLRLWPLIDALIDWWNELPDNQRELLREASRVGSAWQEWQSNRDIASTINMGRTLVHAAKGVGARTASELWNGNLQTEESVRMVTSLFTSVDDGIYEVLDGWGAGPVADALRGLNQPVTDYLLDNGHQIASDVDAVYHGIIHGDTGEIREAATSTTETVLTGGLNQLW
jgi:hypothetical protein